MSELTRRALLSRGLLAMFFCANSPLHGMPKQSLPWRNWSGALSAHPAGRLMPESEDELAQMLASTSGSIRPVGSGHSFSALVPTDGHIVVADHLSGMLSHDKSTMQATFGAGTRLGEMGPQLDVVGQAMFNLPDIDRQTLAGAISTATHGTGLDFSCLSHYVTGLRLISPEGKVIDLDAQHNTDLFDAARVSLGALGVITRVSLQNRSSYRLRSKSWIQRTEEVLESFDESALKHRHFEMFPLSHSDYAITLSTDESDYGIHNPQPTPEQDAEFANIMRAWSQVPPGERRPMINAVAEQIGPTEAVDVSYKILSNVRNTRFNEMEYAVPIESGAACLREILSTISSKNIDVVFPLEYRYVRKDDTWLSMSSGKEDHAAISVHRIADADYRPYFDLIEPIFWKYGGRPHWGKIHSLDAKALASLYPRFRDFQEIRKELDPKGRMLNAHLRKLFI